jgi:hypothetical protein
VSELGKITLARPLFGGGTERSPPVDEVSLWHKCFDGTLELGIVVELALFTKAQTPTDCG